MVAIFKRANVRFGPTLTDAALCTNGRVTSEAKTFNNFLGFERGFWQLKLFFFCSCYKKERFFRTNIGQFFLPRCLASS